MDADTIGTTVPNRFFGMPNQPPKFDSRGAIDGIDPMIMGRVQTADAAGFHHSAADKRAGILQVERNAPLMPLALIALRW